jgi:hypothetical protein
MINSKVVEGEKKHVLREHVQENRFQLKVICCNIRHGSYHSPSFGLFFRWRDDKVAV